jgi:hypothetical protein
MPHENWRDAVAVIHRATGLVTAAQHQVASVAGISLASNLPRLVAAARLKTALPSELDVEPSKPCADYQHRLIDELKEPGEFVDSPADAREADAWIAVLRLKRRARCLEDLALNCGDIVEMDSHGGRIGEVSSIADNGCIYFRGGGGVRAWPDAVSLLHRGDDTSSQAAESRKRAANEAALRARATGWSVARHTELQPYLVEESPSLADIDELEAIIDAAADEKPIQAFMEGKPALLTGLLGGQFRYCLSRLRLADKYIPDFVISDVNSVGVAWLLVEIETPASGVTLAKGNQLDQYARKGVSQIEEWREWLINHIEQARRPARDGDGLGLFDIRPEAPGLVLVGRRQSLRDNATAVRARIKENDNIQVHTYDWLIERLRGAVSFQGPPAGNRYLVDPRGSSFG